MKRRLTLLGLSLMLSAVTAFAQRPMDDDNERRVRIVRGPEIVNVTDDSATINWTTNFSGANQVRYRVAGSNDQWQSAYHQGGGTNHSLQLTGLQPGRTYDWQILTRDGDLRTSGQFQTARRDYRGGDRDATRSRSRLETATEAMTREIMAIGYRCIVPAMAMVAFICTRQTATSRIRAASTPRGRRVTSSHRRGEAPCPSIACMDPMAICCLPWSRMQSRR